MRRELTAIRRVDVCRTLTVSERVRACHDFGIERTFNRVTFEEFAGSEGVRLRAALVAAYGAQAGLDSAAEAIAYGWEHWERLRSMENPTGYLYRVGQNAARRSHRRTAYLPAPAAEDLPSFDPGLLPALASLTESQRVAVVLVHGYGWSQTETARLLDISHATVRTHLARALAHLQKALEVRENAD
jgi:RNA polymerase sigma factor (sigma-70 family)